MLDKHTKISMENHIDLGNYLSELYEEFQWLSLLLYNNGYRLWGNPTNKVLKGISILKSELEECMAQDYRKEWNTDIYYGGCDYKKVQQRIEQISGLRNKP